jgi:hypothetical protein
MHYSTPSSIITDGNEKGKSPFWEWKNHKRKQKPNTFKITIAEKKSFQIWLWVASKQMHTLVYIN